MLLFIFDNLSSAVVFKADDRKAVPHVKIMNLKGDSLNLAEICRDKPAFVFFWATWCKVCSRDMKQVFKLQKEFGDRVQVFGIAWKGKPSAIESYFAKKDKALLSYIDADGKVFETFGFNQTPSVLIINSAGEILFSGYGSFRKYRKILKKELK
jgi:thiol-disulfide isomerase/thioredoxin